MSDLLPRASTGAGLDAFLLEAKLSAPRTRAGTVSRSGVIDAARSSGCRVVGITAPAGYGKSTLLAEWAAAEDRLVAWVSLDRFDDDPAVLLTLLASAYAHGSPGDSDLVADVSGVGSSVLGRGAPRLASAFQTSDSPFVLMVDDLHELRSPACHDVLEVVLSGIPRGSQVVAASRVEQPHLQRLRESGDALEIGASDLALDAAGAETIFSHAQVGLTAESAAVVTARTEGWPAGIYLAARIAKDSGDEAVPISGDDRYVTDYLYRESLMHLPDSTQRFLRRTAILDQMCAPLCDALLGETAAEHQLRSLAASNQFLIPLDSNREWYRYHGLFREFLSGELRRVEPEIIAGLHRRAADWYHSNGSPALALEHLLNTNERVRCVELVTALALPTYQAGQISTVQRWLASLGTSEIEGYPPLAVLTGWIVALTGQTVEALRWAAFLDAASFDLAPLDGSASFESGRAMLRTMLCPAGPEQCMADAELAVSQEPPGSVWRDQALFLLGEAHLLVGDVDRATALFAESATLAAHNGSANVVLMAEAELALLAMDDRQWSTAAEHLTCAIAAIERHRLHDYVLSVIAFAAAARLAVHRGDWNEAERQRTRAMRARQSSTFVLPYFAVRVRLQLAEVSHDLRDAATARHLMREIDDVLLHRPALGVYVSQVEQLRQVLSDVHEPGGGGVAPLTPAELRLLPYLQTHLTIREIAERLFVSRNTVSSELSSIYRKLGVSSRGGAVQQATSIGLLGA